MIILVQSCKWAKILGLNREPQNGKSEPEFDLRPYKQDRKSPKVKFVILNAYELYM